MKEYRYKYFDNAALKYLFYRLIFPLGSLLIGFAVFFCIAVFLGQRTYMGSFFHYYGNKKIGILLLIIMLIIPVVQYLLSKYFQYEGFAAQTIYAEDNSTIGVVTIGFGKHTKPELIDVDDFSSGITHQIYTYKLLKILQGQEYVTEILQNGLDNQICIFDMFTIQNVYKVKKNMFGYLVVADILHRNKPIKKYKMHISYKYNDVEHLIERLSSLKADI